LILFVIAPAGAIVFKSNKKGGSHEIQWVLPKPTSPCYSINYRLTHE